MMMTTHGRHHESRLTLESAKESHGFLLELKVVSKFVGLGSSFVPSSWGGGGVFKECQAVVVKNSASEVHVLLYRSGQFPKIVIKLVPGETKVERVASDHVYSSRFPTYTKCIHIVKDSRKAYDLLCEDEGNAEFLLDILTSSALSASSPQPAEGVSTGRNEEGMYASNHGEDLSASNSSSSAENARTTSRRRFRWHGRVYWFARERRKVVDGINGLTLFLFVLLVFIYTPGWCFGLAVWLVFDLVAVFSDLFDISSWLLNGPRSVSKETPLRLLVSFIANYVCETWFYKFCMRYIIVTLPSMAVLLISVVSIISHRFPRLLQVAMFQKYSKMLVGAIGLLLLHDAFKNYLLNGFSFQFVIRGIVPFNVLATVPFRKKLNEPDLGVLIKSLWTMLLSLTLIAKGCWHVYVLKERFLFSISMIIFGAITGTKSLLAIEALYGRYSDLPGGSIAKITFTVYRYVRDFARSNLFHVRDVMSSLTSSIRVFCNPYWNILPGFGLSVLSFHAMVDSVSSYEHTDYWFWRLFCCTKAVLYYGMVYLGLNSMIISGLDNILIKALILLYEFPLEIWERTYELRRKMREVVMETRKVTVNLFNTLVQHFVKPLIGSVFWCWENVVKRVLGTLVWICRTTTDVVLVPTRDIVTNSVTKTGSWIHRSIVLPWWNGLVWIIKLSIRHVFIPVRNGLISTAKGIVSMGRDKLVIPFWEKVLSPCVQFMWSRVFRPFVHGRWKQLGALLALVNGAIFFRSFVYSVLSNGKYFDSAGLLLGAYTCSICGMEIWRHRHQRAIPTRTGRSLLKYVDLNLFKVLRFAIKTISQGIKIVMERIGRMMRFLRPYVDKVIKVWNVIWDRFIFPMVHMTLLRIWRSPYFSFIVASIGLMFVFLIDRGVVQISIQFSIPETYWVPVDEWLLNTRVVGATTSIWDGFVKPYLFEGIGTIYEHTIWQISESMTNNENQASPHLAYLVWLFVSVASLKEHVNIKTLVHMMCFNLSCVYASFSSTTKAQSSLIFRLLWFLTWVGVQVYVGHYEQRQRSLAQNSWSRFQNGLGPDSRKRVTRSDADATGFNQTECPICLCDFESGESCTSLPCGHSFHSECITKWLAQSNRCPNCRAAAGGLDLALEYFF